MKLCEDGSIIHTTKTVTDIIMQMVAGLQRLHSCNVTLQNINAENVLIIQNPNAPEEFGVRFINFDNASMEKKGESDFVNDTRIFKIHRDVSFKYTPPEYIENTMSSDFMEKCKNIDIWNLGHLILQFIFSVTKCDKTLYLEYLKLIEQQEMTKNNEKYVLTHQLQGLLIFLKVNQEQSGYQQSLDTLFSIDSTLRRLPIFPVTQLDAPVAYTEYDDTFVKRFQTKVTDSILIPFIPTQKDFLTQKYHVGDFCHLNKTLGKYIYGPDYKLFGTTETKIIQDKVLFVTTVVTTTGDKTVLLDKYVFVNNPNTLAFKEEIGRQSAIHDSKNKPLKTTYTPFKGIVDTDHNITYLPYDELKTSLSFGRSKKQSTKKRSNKSNKRSNKKSNKRIALKSNKRSNKNSTQKRSNKNSTQKRSNKNSTQKRSALKHKKGR
jgi:serine/threonine protein kinase